MLLNFKIQSWINLLNYVFFWNYREQVFNIIFSITDKYQYVTNNITATVHVFNKKNNNVTSYIKLSEDILNFLYNLNYNISWTYKDYDGVLITITNIVLIDEYYVFNVCKEFDTTNNKMDNLWQYTKSLGLITNDNIIIYSLSTKSMNVNWNINLNIKSFN